MENSLKNIISEGLKNISNLFNSNNSNKEALGIDIGSSSIKVVQLKKKGGKAVLQTYGVISLGPYAKNDLGVVTNLRNDDLAKALIDVMRESNVTAKSTITSIPSLSSLIFTITLPSQVSDDQLAKIIPMEARKYIPVPISEVTLDWSVIPSELSYESNSNSKDQNQSKVEILIIAIHNDTLDRYKDVLKKAGANTNSFEMEIFSNVRSSFPNDFNPILLIDFGASKTKISIIEGGIVRVFHVVNRGSQDISKNISQALGITFKEAEGLKRSVGLDASVDPKVKEIVELSIDYIFSDINSVVLAYEKKYNKNINKVVLVGGGSMLKGLLEKAKENFKTEVTYSNPFSKTEFPAFLSNTLELSGPEFSVAVGLALRQLS